MSQSKDLFIQMRELEVQAYDKEAIINQCKSIKDKILDGELDALQVLIVSKKLQELGKKLEEESRPIAEDKTRLQKGEVYKTESVEVIEKVIGARVDFSQCNDPEWLELNHQAESIKAQLKERESFLNTIKQPMNVVTGDGEVITIHPPIKSGRIGLSLTLK